MSNQLPRLTQRVAPLSCVLWRNGAPDPTTGSPITAPVTASPLLKANTEVRI
jgi:hypothetical protein